MKQIQNLNYTENAVLLWMFGIAMFAGVLAVTGGLFASGLFQIVMLGLAVFLLSIVLAVFVVAILAPFIGNLIRGDDTNLEYPATDIERIDE